VPGGGGTAAIRWTTDEPSDSRVDYGLSPALGSSIGNASLVTAHDVTLPGLASGQIYYYRVTSRDATGNESTSPVDAPGSFTTPVATTVTAFPSSTVIQSGSLRAGNAARLGADDDSYYEVNSTSFGTRTTSAYGRFTSVPNSLNSLRITYKGKNSQTCTQSIAIWRWTTNSWVQLNSQSVGTAERLVNNLAPAGTPADFVSGTSGNGEVRVRVQCTRSSSFFSSWDLLQLEYSTP
jgi:hypothetical protein